MDHCSENLQIGLGWPLHPAGAAPEPKTTRTLVARKHRETRRSVTPWVTGGNDARATNKNRKEKAAEKKWWHFFRLASLMCLLNMCFLRGLVVVNVFEEKLSWRLLLENSYRLRLGGMNNLEELATHGISLKWLSQKRQACFG